VKDKEKLYEKPTLYTLTRRENQVKCKCGHTVEFWHGENKVLCNWCGDYVFKSKLEEIKHRMKGRLKK
jgi:ribosomal protein S27E